MEGVESKKITTKFYNKVKFCIRAGPMTARNNVNYPWGKFHKFDAKAPTIIRLIATFFGN